MDMTICVSLKNRSRFSIGGGAVLQLFVDCIFSIEQAAESLDQTFFLSIADFESDDIQYTIEALSQCNRLQWNITTIRESYSSGLGLNTAVEKAPTKLIFLLDADMLVSDQLFRRAFEVASEGCAYFPVCWSYRDIWHAEGWWRWEGFGNSALTTDQFNQVGGVRCYNRWGLEDDHFYQDLQSKGIGVVREKGFSFYHQWHPNSLQWKERYYDLETPDNRTG